MQLERMLSAALRNKDQTNKNTNNEMNRHHQSHRRGTNSSRSLGYWGLEYSTGFDHLYNHSTYHSITSHLHSGTIAVPERSLSGSIVGMIGVISEASDMGDSK